MSEKAKQLRKLLSKKAEEIEKPKLGKIILNIKEKPKMSEEKKNKLIKRMNTAMEIQKMKIEKESMLKKSDNILERAKIYENKISKENEK